MIEVTPAGKPDTKIGWFIHETVGMGIINPRALAYRLPDEWVLAVHEFLKGKKFKRPLFSSGVPISGMFFDKKQATRICKYYLRLHKKYDWPRFMGISPIMDEVLSEKFKK